MRESKPKTKTSSHPPMKEMVINAISSLRERKGSSLYAIKKFIGSTYNVDVNKLAHFIKKSIKSAVTSGEIIQSKGRGASGSFLMSKSKVSQKASATKTKTPKSSSEIKKKVVKKKSGEKRTTQKLSNKNSRTSMLLAAASRRKIECR